MKEEVKIVARTKADEMLKGFIVQQDLIRFSKGKSVYLRFAVPGNSVGTMICQDQISAMFEVKTFEGRKPMLFKRVYLDAVRMLKRHAAVVLASTLMVSLSLAGLIVLL